MSTIMQSGTQEEELVPVWNGKVYETVEDGKEWWRNADVQELNVSMGISMPKRLT